MLDALNTFFTRFPWAFYLTRLVVLATSLTLHEMAHAWTATLLGDPTPRQERRLWPNPNRHLEHLGTLVGLFAGLGWGRHVHIKPWLMKVPPKLGGLIVALAGPTANGLLAGLGVLAMRRIGVGPDAPWSAWPSPAEWLTVWVRQNIALALFNLLPLYSLDGYWLIHDVLPLKPMVWWESIAGKTTLVLGIVLAALLLMPIPLYERLAVPPMLAVYDLIGWR